MTDHPRHWCNLSGEQAKLIHVNHEGLAYVMQPRDVVAAMDTKLTVGEDPATVLGPWGRIPWSKVACVEWSSSLEVCWRYEVPGHGTHSAAFVAKSAAEREIIVAAVASLSGLTKSERTRTLPEMVKGPAATVAMVLFLGGVLWWHVGAVVSGGGRGAGRAAFVTTVANGLGYGGIGLLSLLGVGAGLAVLMLRLKNPPRVGRLLPAHAV